MRSPGAMNESTSIEQNRAPIIEIDPRITATAAAAIEQSQAQAKAQQAAAEDAEKLRTETSDAAKVSPKTTTPPTVRVESPAQSPVPVIQAQKLPSIAALIHGPEIPALPITGNRSRGNSRTGSASPTLVQGAGSAGPEKAKGPSDISHDRLGNDRLLKAKPYDDNHLKMLDRKFHI